MPPVGAAYGYILIPRQPAIVPPTNLYILKNYFYQVENECVIRRIPAYRADLFNGDRTYRTLLGNLWRFDHDQFGAFIGRPPLNQWRWGYTDPTIAVGRRNSWEPIGDS